MPFYITAIMSHSPQEDYTEFSTFLRSLFLTLMTLLSDVYGTDMYLNIYFKLTVNKQ